MTASACRLRPLVHAASIALAVMLLLPAAATAAPRTGNWEATAPGRVLSFALVQARGGLAVRDLVVAIPRCSQQGALTQLAQYGTVTPGGSFGTPGEFLTGRFTGPRSGVVRIDAIYQGGCRVNVVIGIRLTRRVAERTGQWRGQSQLGDPVSISVGFGGRTAQITATTTLDVCGASPIKPSASAGPLFVAASGTVTLSQLDYHVRFVSPTRATGFYRITGACAHDVPVELSWVGP